MITSHESGAVLTHTLVSSFDNQGANKFKSRSSKLIVKNSAQLLYILLSGADQLTNMIFVSFSIVDEDGQYKRPKKDHAGPVIALDACQKLGIFITCR